MCVYIWLYTSLESKSPTHKPSSCELLKKGNVCSHVQSYTSVHMSGIPCHVPVSSTVVVASCILLCSTIESTVVQYLYFKSRMSRSKHKSSGDIVGTTVLFKILYCKVQFRSVTQSCLALCDPMDYSTPGLPVHHQLPEFTQTHVHWVGDAIQLSHPLLSPSPPAFNLS